ncbi:MAG: hypothetical protein P8K10_04365 [Crocinitomicaceae bacterium]|nr:hypothetical protein [Crocinitomicaceae bacterium]
MFRIFSEETFSELNLSRCAQSPSKYSTCKLPGKTSPVGESFIPHLVYQSKAGIFPKARGFD